MLLLRCRSCVFFFLEFLTVISALCLLSVIVCSLVIPCLVVITDILLPPSVHFPSMDDDADGSPTPSEDGNLWTDAALDGVAGLDWVPAV